MNFSADILFPRRAPEVDIDVQGSDLVYADNLLADDSSNKQLK